MPSARSQRPVKKVLVTGAGGFLGGRLVRKLLSGVPGLPEIRQIVALDMSACLVKDPRVDVRTGTLTNADCIRAAVTDDVDVVYHLAAVLSGQAEAEFDLGMEVNIDASRALLEACRRLDHAPRFIFASSLAVFGGDMPKVVPEDMVLLPQSSYGTEKAVVEILVSDYSRRGFIDGIVCRLPTVTVRPGRPNSAASSFVSGIIREPLAGVESVCPVPLDTRLWVSSPATVVDNLVHAATVPAEALGMRRALNLPGLTVTPAEMLDSLERLGGKKARKLVRHEEDPKIMKIVCSWPGAFDVRRSQALGFKGDKDFDSFVRQYMADRN
jgi:D-erythronate 2-dehydrogenase